MRRVDEVECACAVSQSLHLQQARSFKAHIVTEEEQIIFSLPFLFKFVLLLTTGHSGCFSGKKGERVPSITIVDLILLESVCASALTNQSLQDQRVRIFYTFYYLGSGDWIPPADIQIGSEAHES